MTNAECSAVDQSLQSILVNSGVVEVMDEGVHLCLWFVGRIADWEQL